MTCYPEDVLTYKYTINVTILQVVECANNQYLGLLVFKNRCCTFAG